MCIPFKVKIKKSVSVFFLILFISALQFSQLYAQNETPDTLLKERIQYIQKMLDQGKPAANLWWKGWLYGYSAATVVQGAVAFTSDQLKTRQDMALGAATTLIGAVGQLIMPMTPASAPGKLSLMPGNTPEERINKLNKAEELFEASALREKDGRSWKMHVASSAVNLSGGMITWLGFDRTIESGLINFAINEVITEVQIWTQPTRAIKDYKKYSEKYINGEPLGFFKPRSQLFVGAVPGGLALKLVF
jgi:hypothetical protein